MGEHNTKLLVTSLLLALPIAGSLIVWIRVLLAYPRRIPLFDFRIDQLPRERRLYLFFAGSFIAIAQALIVPGLMRQIQIPPTIDSRGLQVQSIEIESQNRLRLVQLGCGREAMIFCIGLMVVLAMPREERHAAGFHVLNLKEQSWSGTIGFVAALLPVYLIVLATLPLRSSNTQHDLLKQLSGESGLNLTLWICLEAILLAPLAEEMMYRVLLQGGLVQAGYSPTVSITIVALFFCANHRFPDSLPLIPLALILGWVYHLRNSFLACAMIHVLFNGYNVAATLLATWLE